MRALFFPAWLDGLPRQSASPRIRAEWVCKYWQGAEVYNGTQSPAEFDVLVFQKCYLTDPCRAFAERYEGVKVGDLCDPEWLDRNKLARLHDHIDQMDAVVTSTEALAQWFKPWLPTFFIPDGIDLALHELRTGDEEPYFPDDVGLVWFGGSQNYPALESLIPVVATMGLPLATISDAPYPHLPWIEWEGVEQCNDWLKRFEVVLNPQPDWAPWTYKSWNKSLTAWALGLPVASDARGLQHLIRMTKGERWAIGMQNRDRAEREGDVRLAVKRWQEVIEIVGKWGGL